ncbi:MAG: alpha/beta hydrolase [Firmicutes bacterium]|nr:alpha/beta hydrolase [Bacillota bacterium]
MWPTIVLVLLVLLLTSTVIHHLLRKREEKKNPSPGKMLTIDESKMHIYGQGEGEPTLVFSCGAGSFSLGMYYRTFCQLAQTTRVVLYDRFGYGWSESTNTPRTFEQINSELMELLDKSGEKGPYVLIGHSLGAVEVFQCAQRYPEQVAGVVLLDSAHLEKKPIYYFMNAMVFYFLAFLRTAGILRLLVRLKAFDPFKDVAETGHYPEDIMKTNLEMFYNKICTRNSLHELKEYYKDTDLDKQLGDMPLLVLTAEHARTKAKNYQKLVANHKHLASLSTNSVHKILPGTDHMFPVLKPDLVTEEIKLFMNSMVPASSMK